MSALEAVELLDSPIGPCEPRFWMRPAPDRLTIAFHRDARGVWETVSEEFPAQESLWEVVEFTRVGAEPARPWIGRGTNWGARALYVPTDQVDEHRTSCVASSPVQQEAVSSPPAEAAQPASAVVPNFIKSNPSESSNHA